MDSRHLHIREGFLEVYCGTMKSGKSRELINRLDKLAYVEDCSFLLFKPRTDTRDTTVKSRFGKLSAECIFVDENSPQELLKHITEAHSVIAIDEAQFFSEELVDVVQALLKRRMNVIVAGLELDFRGEPFGTMPKLLCLADKVHKLQAVCDVPGCTHIGTRPQRLVNGKPAHYSEPQVLVGDAEHYEVRCIQHHIVPGRPTKDYAVLDSTLETD